MCRFWWEGFNEIAMLWDLMRLQCCAGQVADTGSTYKYKMQLKGEEKEEELTGEYTGVDVSKSDPPEGGCTDEVAVGAGGNEGANIVPDPPSSNNSSLPQGEEEPQQQEVGSEVKEEQSQEEAAAT